MTPDRRSSTQIPARLPACCAVALSFVCLHAHAAPELVANGGGEQPIAVGWTVAQPEARSAGLLRDGPSDFFTARQGQAFLVLEQGGRILQAGSFPTSSERVYLRTSLRAPTGSIELVLRGLDRDGQVLIERSAVVERSSAWVSADLTYTIPLLADAWQIELRANGAGPAGVHADAISMIGTCQADINGDRLVNFFDILDFLALFASDDPEADLTGDGQINFFDLDELLELFLFVCP